MGDGWDIGYRYWWRALRRWIRTYPPTVAGRPSCVKAIFITIEFDGFIGDVVRGLRLRFRSANKPVIAFQIIKVRAPKLIGQCRSISNKKYFGRTSVRRRGPWSGSSLRLRLSEG
jgi:hypothetical protein